MGSDTSPTVELVCAVVVATCKVLELVAGGSVGDGSAGAGEADVAAASWEGVNSFDNLVCPLLCVFG